MGCQVLPAIGWPIHGHWSSSSNVKLNTQHEWSQFHLSHLSCELKQHIPNDPDLFPNFDHPHLGPVLTADSLEEHEIESIIDSRIKETWSWLSILSLMGWFWPWGWQMAVTCSFERLWSSGQMVHTRWRQPWFCTRWSLTVLFNFKYTQLLTHLIFP